MKEANKDRFQDQPWYVKLWRYRWYLYIPFRMIQIYLVNRNKLDNDLYFIYSLAMGEAHYKMKWLYSMEEAMKILENKRKK